AAIRRERGERDVAAARHEVQLAVLEIGRLVRARARFVRHLISDDPVAVDQVEEGAAAGPQRRRNAPKHLRVLCLRLQVSKRAEHVDHGVEAAVEAQCAHVGAHRLDLDAPALRLSRRRVEVRLAQVHRRDVHASPSHQQRMASRPAAEGERAVARTERQLPPEGAGPGRGAPLGDLDQPGVVSRPGPGRTVKRVAVLASGGLDSAVLIADLAGEAIVFPVYVEAGLAWEEGEKHALRAFLDALNDTNVQPLTALELPLRRLYGEHWSTTGESVPDYGAPDSA